MEERRTPPRKPPLCKMQNTRSTSITTAEKWTGTFSAVDESELDELFEAMPKKHLNHYTNCDDWDYFLFADGSVYSNAGNQCLTKTELLEASKAGLSDMYVRGSVAS